MSIRRHLIGDPKPPSRVDFLDEDQGPVREIPTPEGVSLAFTVAPGGDRAAAFVMDMFFIWVFTFLMSLVAFSALPGADAMIAQQFLFFFLRHGYFAGSEILWRGRTIGKRIVKTQVIDRAGGPLRVEAIFARNLTREIETYFPLLLLFAEEALFPDLPAWGTWLVLIWVAFFAFFPLFNRERLRFGDILAGTIVVRAPKPILARDLGSSSRSADGGAAAEPRFTFTREQLEKYGIYELQVLEKVLRQRDVRATTLRSITDRIAKKIGYTGRTNPTREFLRDFYRAQRAFLEGRMLMGDKREDKHAVRGAKRGDGPPPVPPRS